MRSAISIFVLSVVVFIASAIGLHAQSPQLKRANHIFDRLAFAKAIPYYERALKLKESAEGYSKLGDCYRLTGNASKASEAYAKAIANGSNDPKVWYNHGYVLKMTEKYEAAKAAFAKFQDLGGSRTWANKQIASCSFADQLSKSTPMYSISPLGINSPASDFAPVVAGKDLYFTSCRFRGKAVQYLDSRDNRLFYDIYCAENGHGGSVTAVKRLKGKVNSRYHDGPFVFANDSTMFFTRTLVVKGKVQRDTSGISRLGIYEARKKGDRWKVAGAMPFLDGNSSNAHAALSPDRKTLVFASNMPGGQGGLDLYVSKFESGKWSKPTNLGSSVNTIGEESFPGWWDAETLIFASDGHLGMGGLDLFTTVDLGERWTAPENLGFPLNSTFDDFAVNWLPERASGYFSSNRAGSDDLYTFRRNVPVELQVVDARTKKPISNVSLEVENVSGQKSKLVTDSDGKAAYVAEWKREYRLAASVAKYEGVSKQFTTQNGSPLDQVQVLVEMTKALAVTGTITDASNGKPILHSLISVENDGAITRLRSDQTGYFEHPIAAGKEYYLVLQATGYVPQVLNFSTMDPNKLGEQFFPIKMQPGSGLVVLGQVVRQKTDEPLAGVDTHGEDWNSGAVSNRVKTNKNGRFGMVFPVSEQYIILASSANFFSARTDLPDSLPADTLIHVKLGLVDYKVGELVKMIHHSYNMADIQLSAARDLDEIVYFLLANPTAVVSLESHTDSRGGEVFNKELSDRRAKAAVDYILGKGVSSNSLRGIGLGESQLSNECKDDVPCTDTQHAENRRTAIWVRDITEQLEKAAEVQPTINAPIGQ